MKHDAGAPLTPVNTPYSTSDITTLTIQICRSLSDKCKTEGKLILFIVCVVHSVADLGLCTEPKPEVDDVRLPEKGPVTCSEPAGSDANERKVSPPKKKEVESRRFFDLKYYTMSQLLSQIICCTEQYQMRMMILHRNLKVI